MNIDSSSLDEGKGGFAVFQNRARAPQGFEDESWRIGFAPGFRSSHEASIVQAIFKLFDSHVQVRQLAGSAFLDIGCGASAFTQLITEWCYQRGMIHVAIDGEPMLLHLPEDRRRIDIPGQFPGNKKLIEQIQTPASMILAYSVMQYVVRDGLGDDFCDGVVSLLPPGGVAFLGDIPNRDKRDRQLRIERGPIPPPQEGEIRDEMIRGWMSIAHDFGCNAYLVPHFRGDPMELFREHLVIIRPESRESK